MEVFPASWLPGHESDGSVPARKTSANPGFWAAHEHHCWRHHWSAFHQKQGDSCSLTCFLIPPSVLPASLIFPFLPAAPRFFVFMLHHVLAIDISSCLMLFQIFFLKQCRDFHKATYVKCIPNNNINACWVKTENVLSQERLSFYDMLWTHFVQIRWLFSVKLCLMIACVIFLFSSYRLCSLLLGNQRHPCKRWSRIIPGGQHPHDCGREW